MSLQDRLKQLDELVTQGKLEAAVEQFYHPNVVCYSNLNDVTIGKEEKLQSIRAFRNSVALINHIGLRNQTFGANVTMSEFMIDIAYKFGKRVVREEIIKRVWLDGMIMEERYYTLDPAPPLHPISKNGMSYQFLTKVKQNETESEDVEVVNDEEIQEDSPKKVATNKVFQAEEAQEEPMSVAHEEVAAPNVEVEQEQQEESKSVAEEEVAAPNVEVDQEQQEEPKSVAEEEASKEEESTVETSEEVSNEEEAQEEEAAPVMARGVLTAPVFQQEDDDEEVEEEAPVMARGISSVPDYLLEDEEEDDDPVLARGVMSTPVFRGAEEKEAAAPKTEESALNSESQEGEIETEVIPEVESRGVSSEPVSPIPAEEKTLARTVKPNVELPEVTPEPVTSIIHFDKSGEVESIELLLDLSHTYIGDLTINLISPEGTKVAIHEEEGGSRNKIKRTYSGDVFSDFVGEEIHGDWILEISDSSPRDAGWLNLWGLIIDLKD